MAGNSQTLARWDTTFAAGAVSLLLEGSEDFRRFSVQVIGGQVGQAITFLASLDGTNYVTIATTATVTAAAPGALIQFEMPTKCRGGVKVAFANAAGTGSIHVSMEGNSSARGFKG